MGHIASACVSIVLLVYTLLLQHYLFIFLWGILVGVIHVVYSTCTSYYFESSL